MSRCNLALATLAFIVLGSAVARAQVVPAPTQESSTVGAYNAVPPVCTTGNFCRMQVDASGNLKTTTGTSPSAGAGITPVVSAAAEATHVFKASPGNVYSAYATNLTSTSGFFVLINATAAPADGAITPLACVPLPANGNATLNFNPGPPQVYSTGIVGVVSSAATCFTKTTGVITAYLSGSVQ